MAAPHFPIPPFPTREFKTREEMMAHFEARRAATRDADARITPWQAALDVGDKLAYEWRYADGTPVTIYYEVKRSPYKEDRFREDEYWPTRVFGWGYSVYCPEGEPGSTHRSVFTKKLTEGEWTAAMAEIQAINAVRAAVLK